MKTLALASVPALAAIVAAVIASRSAGRARESTAETERLRLLEQRVAQRKFEVYKPMIDFLGRMLSPGEAARIAEEEYVEKIGDFSRWVAIVGSDDAVRAFRNLMQGTYNSAPAAIVLRLFADFQIAARRDMGDPDTNITSLDILGMRINDLYQGDLQLAQTISLPFELACEREQWDIPWMRQISGAD